MKKIISLLLAAIMLCAMLGTVGFAADSGEIHPELASIKAYGSDDPSNIYYFEDLDQSVIDFVCLNLSGDKVLTLLQDTEIYSLSEANPLVIPTGSAKWYNKDLIAAQKHPVVLDLNGNTLTFIGGGNLFYTERFSITVKNGTLIYTNTANQTRAPFCLGSTTGATANSGGTSAYFPIVTLENVHVYSSTEYAVKSFIYNSTVNITDSVVWAKGNAVGLFKSKQTKWTGEFAPALNVKNSIVGSDTLYFVNGVEGATATVEDSVVVSNSTKNPIAKTSKLALTTVGDKTEDLTWTMGLRNGTTVKGNAYTFGTAPVVLPFADVKPADWFYSFVKEMYEQKIIAGQTATTFNPAGNLTYGAALKLLTVGVTGKDAGNAASGHWATNYLNEAKAAGWTDIGADKLEAPVTREAFCEIAAKAKNLTAQPASNPFKDTADTSVLALVNAGVINGMSADTFNPTGVLTRAQIAKIISLLIKL